MKISTWKDATEAGLARYFTGKPCKRGHISERTTRGRTCIQCAKSLNAAYSSENSEKIRGLKRRHYSENPDKHKEYREKYKEKRNENSRLWRSANSDKVNAYKATRIARIKKSTPSLNNELMVHFHREISEKYSDALRLTEETGLRYEVDHIFPLSRGGVHAPWNLRVIPKSENRSKYNRIPEAPPFTIWRGVFVIMLVDVED